MFVVYFMIYSNSEDIYQYNLQNDVLECSTLYLNTLHAKCTFPDHVVRQNKTIVLLRNTFPEQ
jgi:hypothetical protein